MTKPVLYEYLTSKFVYESENLIWVNVKSEILRCLKSEALSTLAFHVAIGGGNELERRNANRTFFKQSWINGRPAAHPMTAKNRGPTRTAQHIVPPPAKTAPDKTKYSLALFLSEAPHSGFMTVSVARVTRCGAHIRRQGPSLAESGAEHGAES